MLMGALGIGTPSRMHGMEGSLKYSPDDLWDKHAQGLTRGKSAYMR